MNLLETVQHLQADAKSAKAISQIVPTTDHVNVAVVPAGYEVKVIQLDQFLDRPRRLAATFKAQTVESFIGYVNRHRRPETIITADCKSLAVKAVLDYHADVGLAGNCLHNVSYELYRTTEWDRFLRFNEKHMKQLEFAEFVEDSSAYFFAPPAAHMKDVARHLVAKKDANYESAQRLQDGSFSFKYTEEIKATVGTGSVEVPEEFTLRLIPFAGYIPVEVKCRLRFRFENNKLEFFYKIHEPHKVAEAVFNDVVQSISAECGEVLMGSL